MPKPLNAPKWYEVLDAHNEEHEWHPLREVPNQPEFDGKPDARRWMLGSKDEPGHAPGSGKYLLLRQLDELDVVVQTVRTVVKAESLMNDATPGTGDPLPDEAEAEEVWADSDGQLL